MTRFFLAAPLLAALLLLPACGGGDKAPDLTNATAYTLENEPLAKDFARLYPDATHAISYAPEDRGGSAWTSNAKIQNKFELAMSFPIEIDGDTASRTGEPSFNSSRSPPTTRILSSANTPNSVPQTGRRLSPPTATSARFSRSSSSQPGRATATTHTDATCFGRR